MKNVKTLMGNLFCRERMVDARKLSLRFKKDFAVIRITDLSELLANASHKYHRLR